MTDAELVRQARAGRAQAYEELVRRWSPRVLALCHARVGRADVAEDLAQEALLRSYRGLGSLSHPDRFGAWLQGIALRACLDWLKAGERRTRTFTALGPACDPGSFLDPREPDDLALDRDDERRRLLAEVGALPEECRTVILLYYYQDITYRELADTLGVSPATVNARLTRARALLRARLSRAGR